MAEAARALVGTHDFASFAAAGSAVETTTRRLDRLEVAGEAGGEVVVEAAGGGFLRHMVRNLVGTLLEIGLGRRAPDEMAAILRKHCRTFELTASRLARVDGPEELVYDVNLRQEDKGDLLVRELVATGQIQGVSLLPAARIGES